MSLLPMLFSSWWEDLERPHRLFDQNFGLSLSPDDLPRPSDLVLYDPDMWVMRPRRRGNRRYRPYDRSVVQKSSGGVSTVKADKDQFLVMLDVQHFAPDEITVKASGNSVMVEGKHEEKQDEHGWVSRQFVRKYLVPEQCDIEQLKSTLSSDGVLTISAPRKKQEENANERIIRIETTGQPALRDERAESNEMSEQNVPVQKNPGHQRTTDKTVKAG